MSTPTLAAAALRLRRRPGRPRTRPQPDPGRGVDNPGAPIAAALEATIPPSCRRSVADPEPASGRCVESLRPRLVDLTGAAAYLAVKPWHVRDLIRAGTLARVSVPLGPDRRGRRADGVLRRVLVDLADLDHLVDVWKAGATVGARSLDAPAARPASRPRRPASGEGVEKRAL